jgi:hypothetical protein
MIGLRLALRPTSHLKCGIYAARAEEMPPGMSAATAAHMTDHALTASTQRQRRRRHLACAPTGRAHALTRCRCRCHTRRPGRAARDTVALGPFRSVHGSSSQARSSGSIAPGDGRRGWRERRTFDRRCEREGPLARLGCGGMPPLSITLLELSHAAWAASSDSNAVTRGSGRDEPQQPTRPKPAANRCACSVKTTSHLPTC